MFPALPPTVEDSSHMKERSPGMGDICFWSLRTINNLPHICATKTDSTGSCFSPNLSYEYPVEALGKKLASDEKLTKCLTFGFSSTLAC